MSKLKVFIIFICCNWAFVVHAADPSAQLATANQAYQANEFKRAIEQYENLLQQDYRSEVIYYNLGNSYYRTNDFGKAILNYERALLLAPNDADIQHNLELTRSNLQDKIEPLPPFFLSNWWNELSSWLSPNVWSGVALVLLWSGMIGLSVWLLGKLRTYKKWGFIIGMSFLLLSVISFALANSRQQMIQNSGRAVILQTEIPLHTAPDTKSKVVLPLHAGTTIRFLDSIGDWHKVALDNGEQGWLPKGSFERI